MIFGYMLNTNGSNEEYFFNGNEPVGTLCSVCGTCLNYEYGPEVLSIGPSRKYDVSSTLDLRLLFSTRFVQFCQDVLHSEDNFQLVRSQSRDYFYMMPSRVLEFDVQRRKSRFDKPCEKCGGYDSIVGARPVFLKIDKPLGPGFYRSDIPFGSGKSKAPLYFVGAEWAELLATQKFRGIRLDEINS
jgi:hypothetical protein